VIIPKSASVEWLKENIESFKVELTEEDIKAISELDQGEAGWGFNPKNGWTEFDSAPLFS